MLADRRGFIPCRAKCSAGHGRRRPGPRFCVLRSACARWGIIRARSTRSLPHGYRQLVRLRTTIFLIEGGKTNKRLSNFHLHLELKRRRRRRGSRVIMRIVYPILFGFFNGLFFLGIESTMVGIRVEHTRLVQFFVVVVDRRRFLLESFRRCQAASKFI